MLGRIFLAKKPTIIVIGGGASGLMAAGTAAAHGARVILLEKMARLAEKIRISGKGRCNLTNSAELPEFIGQFGKSGKFLRQPFNRFFSGELITFFQEKGFELIRERGGRYFPRNGNGTDVANFFSHWLTELGVQILLAHPVSGLAHDGRKITGVYCQKKRFQAEAVILAAGGASWPRTGSSGAGYQLAREAGHAIVPVRPSLVTLVPAGGTCSGLAGLDLKNVVVRIYVNGRRKRQRHGEISFMQSAIGGPVILTESLFVVDCLLRKDQVEISIDLKPALDQKKLDHRLLSVFKQRAQEPVASVLRSLLPAQLVRVCLAQVGLAPATPVQEIERSRRVKIRLWLKDFRVKIERPGDISQAMVSAGGVATREINPKSMESKLLKGLYLTGELVDIQAGTGGFNLQAAFSTGYLAGCSAAGDKILQQVQYLPRQD